MSVAQFWLDYGDRVEERQVHVWQLVTTKAPGNSGKIAALEYLNKEDGLFCYEWLRGRLNWWHGDNNKGSGCIKLLKSRTSLVGIDLSRSNYAASGKASGVFLQGINLRRAILTGANLRDANLRDANLRDANLTGTNLIEAKLADAVLSGARLTEAKLVGADLSGAKLIDVIMHKAELNHAILYKADMSDANLIEAKLVGADLTGAKLVDADLSGANLSNSDLSGAKLISRYLSLPAPLRLPSVVELLGADLRDAKLSNSDLSGADLSRARNLHQPQLDEACGDKDTKLPKGLTIKPCK